MRNVHAHIERSLCTCPDAEKSEGLRRFLQVSRKKRGLETLPSASVGHFLAHVLNRFKNVTSELKCFAGGFGLRQA